MQKSININTKQILFLLFIQLISANVLNAQSGTGIMYGPNYMVWEAEATQSPLGQWQIITPDDSRYQHEENVPPIGETHLEFTGNSTAGGNPNSPLEYKFVCPKTGKYKLSARMFQRLEGAKHDNCNDVYVRMAGNFTPGNANLTMSDLTGNTKFVGAGEGKNRDGWGCLHTLETSHHNFASAMYNLIRGEEYILTVSGRSKRTNIDYWILYETSINYQTGNKIDIAEANPEKYLPATVSCKTIVAADMKYTNIDGFTDARPEQRNGMQILSIGKRNAWAAAQYIYKGTNGEATFKINALQEKDGESTYKVKINGTLIGEGTNDKIHGTEIPNYTIQTHVINETAVALKDGDVIQVEFNNTTNGLIPEGDLTATSRGRWASLEICTTGRFAVFKVDVEEEKIKLLVNESYPLKVEAVLPDGVSDVISWTSAKPGVATVENGVVKGLAVGTTNVYASASDGEYMDSCFVTVITSGPFKGKPIAIPGIIEAEDFDNGGEGLTYHDYEPENKGAGYRLEEGVDISADEDGGFNLGWMRSGEWLKYTIDVAETGTYNITAVVGSPSQIGFHIKVDGIDVSGNHTENATGDYNIWKNTTIEGVKLEKGTHVLTLVIDVNWWNLDKLIIEKQGGALNLNNAGIAPAKVYPNPFTSNFTIEGHGASTIKIRTLNGKVVHAQQINRNTTTIVTPDRKLSKGIYLLELYNERKVRTIKIIAV